MKEDYEEKIMKEVVSIMEKYHKEQMRDNAKRLINDFINEELPNKDINELIKFSFWNIKNCNVCFCFSINFYLHQT